MSIPLDVLNQGRQSRDGAISPSASFLHEDESQPLQEARSPPFDTRPRPSSSRRRQQAFVPFDSPIPGHRRFDSTDGERIIGPKWKRDLHMLLERPASSSAATFVHLVSTAFIIFSAVVTILETLPRFHSTHASVWFGLETSIVAIFTVEYIARCIAWSSSFRVFLGWFGSFFAIVDLLSIVPYYVELALQADPASNLTAFFRFSILRTLRLLRMFRPFRYSNTILLTIEVMFLSVQRSKDALLALGFFVLMALVVFSTLLYFAERGTWDDNLETFVNADGDPSSFESIPAAAWFVLVTITTVGYGEIIPRSFLGRLLTVPLLIFGLLLIALPSFVLGREFASVWDGMQGHMDGLSDLQGLDSNNADTPLPSPVNFRRPRLSSANASPAQPPNPSLSSAGAAVLSNTSAMSSAIAQRMDLTNRKLAENQTMLSKQVEVLRQAVERQEESSRRQEEAMRNLVEMMRGSGAGR